MIPLQQPSKTGNEHGMGSPILEKRSVVGESLLAGADTNKEKRETLTGLFEAKFRG